MPLSPTCNAAQGEVDRLNSLEGFKSVVAPFDGVVTERNTDIGALINAGSGVGGGSGPVLFRVEDVHKMRIFVQVPQRMSADIREGLSADLHLPPIPRQILRGNRCHHSSGHQPERAHFAGRTACRQSGWRAAARFLYRGPFQIAARSQRFECSHEHADLPQHGMEVAVIGADNRIELKRSR